MTEWQTTWAEMRAKFLVRAANRLTRICQQIDQLTIGDGVAAMVDLKRDMHWLVGVGGTYKLPMLTELGQEAEHICTRCEESGGINKADIQRLREIVEAALSAVKQ